MSSGIPLTCSSAELSARMLGILERLVGFDTTSHRSNLELISYVQDLLAGNGITCTLQRNAEGTKANLVATAHPAGAGSRGLIWSGHTDVVPVDGQAWTSDPFRLKVGGETAVGRGSTDMKGFIACCLAILTALEPRSLNVPITLVLTYEEEVGCVGARQLVPELRAWAADCIGCVVGEPTGMKVVLGHKGKQNHRARFTSEPKHAALAPESPNPIAAAADFIGFADRLNERFGSVGPYDERFGIGHSWINAGRIDGGVKPNIVPENCLVDLEIRALPGHSCDEIAEELRRHGTENVLAGMRKKYASSTFSLDRVSNTPAFLMDEGHAFVELVRSAFGQDGEPPVYVPFGTEAGHFWGGAGIPTVVCGPGSISEAHTADEWVSLEQLRLCLSSLQALPAAVR